MSVSLQPGRSKCVAALPLILQCPWLSAYPWVASSPLGLAVSFGVPLCSPESSSKNKAGFTLGEHSSVWRAGQCLRQGQILCQRAAFWRNMTQFLWWAPPGLSPLAAQPLCQREVQWLSCCINKEVDSQLLIISFATVIQCIE